MTETAAPADPAKIGDTKTALLEAAERLFADRGIQAASLRAITLEAGANLASVNYHFGSKRGLVRAVFARRLGPLNQERLALLAACGGRRGEDAVRCIVEAFVAPPLRMIYSDAGGPEFARLVARSFSEPDAEVRDLILEQFRPVIDRFGAALRAALPELPAAEIAWRFLFMVGAMAYTAGQGDLLERFGHGSGPPADPEQVIERLVAFLAAGMQAPMDRAGRSDG